MHTDIRLDYIIQVISCICTHIYMYSNIEFCGGLALGNGVKFSIQHLDRFPWNGGGNNSLGGGRNG